MVTHPDPEELIPRLADHGIDVKSIEVVSSNADRFEVMHEVTDSGGNNWYVQTLSPESAERFRSFSKADVRMDVPDYEILPGDPPLLVNDSATGRPLSLVLVLSLAPGIWYLKGDDVRRGVRLLGRNLGRLHTATSEGQASYGDSEIDREKIEAVRTDIDELGFDGAMESGLDELLDSLLETTVVHAMAHRDPSPHNVFYDNGDIELIDLDLSVRPAVIDVALADVGLRLMTARLPYARKRQATALRKALWAGYDETGVNIAPDSETFLTVCITQFCELLRNYARGEVYSLSGRVTAIVDPPLVRRFVREDYARLSVT